MSASGRNPGAWGYKKQQLDKTPCVHIYSNFAPDGSFWSKAGSTQYLCLPPGSPYELLWYPGTTMRDNEKGCGGVLACMGESVGKYSIAAAIPWNGDTATISG